MDSCLELLLLQLIFQEDRVLDLRVVHEHADVTRGVLLLRRALSHALLLQALPRNNFEDLQGNFLRYFRNALSVCFCIIFDGKRLTFLAKDVMQLALQGQIKLLSSIALGD